MIRGDMIDNMTGEPVIALPKCDHEYFHESTHYQRESDGYGKMRYTRLDVYFCHKCLDKKDVVREEVIFSSVEPPIWWQH